MAGLGAVHRGQVECKARQELARGLMCNGPLTARGLAKDAGRSMASARYHLRILCATGAVTPCLHGMAKGDEVVYALSAETLPRWAQETLLGEVSLQTCLRLLGILIFESPQDAAELADRLGLGQAELRRYIQALEIDGFGGELPRLEAGNRPDRIDELPEWVREWLDGEEDAPE